MKRGLKIYSVDFEAIWPVGNCLILAANNQAQAEEMAQDTISKSCEIYEVNELKINKPQIIEFLSGDY